jgi:hypothetical protein
MARTCVPDDLALSVIGGPATTPVMIDVAFESDLSVVPEGKTPISNSYAAPEVLPLMTAWSAALSGSRQDSIAFQQPSDSSDSMLPSPVASADVSWVEELTHDLVERKVAAVGSKGIDEPGIGGLCGAPVGVEPDDFEVERPEPLR